MKTILQHFLDEEGLANRNFRPLDQKILETLCGIAMGNFLNLNGNWSRINSSCNLVEFIQELTVTKAPRSLVVRFDDVSRPPITTKDGYLGMGFSSCVEGETVVVFRGVYFPCVLRPVGDKYKFVGQCYGKIHLTPVTRRLLTLASSWHHGW